MATCPNCGHYPMKRGGRAAWNCPSCNRNFSENGSPVW